MPGGDPVDQESLIFTEGNIFFIAGFLAVKWGVEISEAELVESVEKSIFFALNQPEVEG